MEGIRVAFFKKRVDTQGHCSLMFIVPREPTRYIDSLPLTDQQRLENHSVVVDPGRRYLLYCVHEDFIVQEKIQ
jgi:hypothetical protein